MQIDMHFYCVYAMARAAGIDPETSKTIAHASQFVDDAIEDEQALIANSVAVVPTMTSHRPLDYRNALPGEQWKVWIPFHFLPGNDPTAKTFVERMVTLPDSEPAKQMLLDTLDKRNRIYWPHLIGIAAHVYADTFSHFGFVGFASQWNQVKDYDIKILNIEKRSGIFKYVKGKLEEFKARLLSPMAEIVPVGHGSVATLPDRPYLEWSFSYQTHTGKPFYKRRNNTDNFMTACQKLYNYFNDFAKISAAKKTVTPNKKWNEIRTSVKSLLEIKEPVDQRIESWKKAILKGVFCTVTDFDKAIKYDKFEWVPKNLPHQRLPGQKLEKTDTCSYIRAAWRHRNYVLHELLPKFDLVKY